jgi:hypothetical protein
MLRQLALAMNAPNSENHWPYTAVMKWFDAIIFLLQE